MNYNIKAVLSPTDRLVTFDELFEGTRNGFLSLVKANITPEMYGKFCYNALYNAVVVRDPRDGLNKLSFDRGAIWNFSTIDKDLMFEVYAGIARNEKFAFDMNIDFVDGMSHRYVDGENMIKCHPGIIIERDEPFSEGRNMNIFDDEDEFLRKLEENTRAKIEKLAPHLSNEIRINSVNGVTYKRKNARFRDSIEVFSEGVFSINAKAETVDFIAHVGLGDKTHMGFGYMSPLRYQGQFSPHQSRALRHNEVLKTSSGYQKIEIVPQSLTFEDFG